MAISHAGHGTVSTALLHGKPMLLLPEHDHQLEQILTARNVVKLKVGLMLMTIEQQRDYRGLIQKVLNEPLFTENAQRFAEKYKDFDPGLQLVKTVERCEELIGL